MNTLESKAVSPRIPPPRGWVETVPHGKATLDLENQGLTAKNSIPMAREPTGKEP
ncbi:hypothetical protein [Plectonema phage JingP1]|uniref:Uncharacterized protein n=1 Tax=Plectonema phage JingP1 TaxID=2961687 RepID=A0A9E7NPA6_9CAUD|nr:hypothetical protein [Plectonema phage JingP1]